jgi:AcrR family transcriptional regulator
VPTPDAAAPGAREALREAARAELVEGGSAGISLRAVARRAGVSHAAPKYHFADRAGLLTAIAAEGFAPLTVGLRRVTESDAQKRLAALGRAYIDFGLANPAMFDLMFRPGELHAEDPALRQAQQEAIGTLSSAVAQLSAAGSAAQSVPPLSLISWALVHGLVVLARDGALQAAAGAAGPVAPAELARQLATCSAHTSARRSAGTSWAPGCLLGRGSARAAHGCARAGPAAERPATSRLLREQTRRRA